MSKIVYYVASSLDGFIAGNNDDISGFILAGPGVEKYQQDLSSFQSVIMGRRTYEFGYQFGLQPGQPAYPGMEHYIFSNTMNIENTASTVHIETRSIGRVEEIKANSKSDIYLCGGGEFAGWLLENKLIDLLKIKLNPVILGQGIRLFGNSDLKAKLTHLGTESFADGMHIHTYFISYS
jgi:dihydrofolate reductase